MKAVMLSIRPQWCELIANGQKTVEVRKNRPKLETPFKCYIYCTVYGSVLWANENLMNGKVVGEFVCDNIVNLFEDSRFWLDEKIVEQICLTGNQLREYADGNDALYGWHISDLQIWGKPRELNEFKQCDKCPCGDRARCDEYEFSCDGTYALKRAPQSWYYTEEAQDER